MRVISVTVESFRGLRGPVTVQLEGGLNVIHGPNEIGKSTLAEAIRAGLTLPGRIGGRTRERLVPRTGGTPRVQVRFEHDAILYDVKKEFGGNRNGSTFLRVEGERTEQLRDDEAEGRLRDVLGVGTVNNRGNFEDLGLWPLVWVEQGQSGIQPTDTLHGSGRTTLSECLAELGGEVFAGHGAEGLFAVVEARYGRYYTGTGGESRSSSAPLAQARARQEAAAESHRALGLQLAEHEERLARHARLHAKLDRLDGQIPRLEEALGDAVRAQEELEKLEVELERVRQKLQLARKDLSGLQHHLHQRSALRTSLGATEEQVRELSGEVSKIEEVLANHRDERPLLVSAAGAAEDARKAAEQQRRRLRAALAEANSTVRLSVLQGQLDLALEHRTELDGIVEQLAGNRITPRILNELQKLQRAAGEARARLDAAAARVEIEAVRPVAAVLAGREVALEPGVIHAERIEAPTEIGFADLVRIRIRPGGEDLAVRREDAQTKENALASRLQDLGLVDVAAAEAASDARQKLDARRETLEAMLNQLQPEALRTAHTQASAERDAARAALEALGPASADLPDEVGALRAAEQIADQAVDVASEAERDATRALGLHDTQDARLDAELDGLRRQLDGARGQLASFHAALERHVEDHDEDQALGARVSDAAGHVEQHEGQVLVIETRVSALDPDQVRREVATAKAAGLGARKERSDTKDQLARLEGELASEQMLGLHDRVQRAETTLHDASGALEAELKRARAAQLLHDTLRDCRSSAQQRHLAPLVDEVHALLRSLFPGAKIQVSDQLDALELDRGTVEGQHPFDELSGGAREQLGVLVRLALARLMATRGGLPILLDDALVATDEERFVRMRKVLDAAAEDLQVIFLTCHWDRLRGLGLAPKHRVDLELVVRGAVDA